MSPQFLPFSSAEAHPGLRAFTSLRGAGDLGLNTSSAAGTVLAGRQRLWKSLGLRLEDSVFMRQVHGEHLAEAGPAQRGMGAFSLGEALPDCDLAIAREPGTLLCVGHADCLAVLMADTKRRIVGVAHMGWRGAALGVAGKLARAMGGDPGDYWIGLSPCLGPCHLELSTEQYAAFEGRPSATQLKDGHFRLDLHREALSQLEAAGFDPGRAEIQGDCTACNLERYYSYRAEAGACGRMMSCAGFML